MAVEAAYESWRYKDRFPKKRENNANSWKWAPPKEVVTPKDSIYVSSNTIIFYHRNQDTTAFDIVTNQQGMGQVKDSLFNPLKNLVSGGQMYGSNFVYAGRGRGLYMDTDFESWILKSKVSSRNHALQLTLHVAQTKTITDWLSQIQQLGINSRTQKAVK